MGLFDLFRSHPKCPIDDETRKWVDYRWAWLEGQFGLEFLRAVTVVLPFPSYFPDPYQGTDEDVRRLLDRVCGYMSIDPACIELDFYRDQNPIANDPTFFGMRWEGTAGLYQAAGKRFLVQLEESQLTNPPGLIATMAHELGHVHLLGHGRVSHTEKDHEPLTDLLTVYFGLGVLTANAVVRESSWHYGAGASGWSVGRSGYLTMPIFGYALARFALARGERKPKWARELRLDVRSAFKQSMRFLAAEAAIKSAEQPSGGSQ